MARASKTPTGSTIKKKAAAPLKKRSNPRRLKAPTYRTFRLSKRIKPQATKLPGAFRLFWRSLVQLKKRWKLFLGIIGSYAILNILLVRGLSSSVDIAGITSTLQSVSQAHFSQLSSGFAFFGLLLGSTGTASSDAGNVYQALLVIIISLALIWGLRQTFSQSEVTIRQAFYHGMYPLVPFILVLLVIGLQLVPIVAGGWLYNTVIGNGLAVSLVEKIMWGLIFFLLAVLSLYMLCSSIFALYIVTLPNMTPFRALRSARQLVLYRRWSIMRKILFMPIALLVIAAIVIVPIIIFVPSTAEWTFFVASMLALAVVHSYMYGLYRELL